MPENNECPTCSDLPGTPVPGQEDVFAFAMPMPPDDQLTPWHAIQPAATRVRTAPNSAAQPPWPEGLFEINAAPETGPAAAQPRVEYLLPLDVPGHQWPIQQQVSPPDAMAGVIQDADDPSVTYLPPLGPPWLQMDGRLRPGDLAIPSLPRGPIDNKFALTESGSRMGHLPGPISPTSTASGKSSGSYVVSGWPV